MSESVSKPTILFPLRLDRAGNPQATIHRTIATNPSTQNSFNFISFANNPLEFSSVQNLKTYWTSSNRFFDALIINFKSIAISYKWDAIHLGPNPALKPLALFAKLFGKKIITTIHEAPSYTQERGSITRYLLELLASVANVRVSVSQFVKKEVQSMWGMNSIVVHNGVDTSFFNPKKRDVSRAEEILCIKLGKRKLVLFVGSLIEGKGVLDVLENCKLRTDVVCAFIGNGPLKQKILDCAKLSPHIIQKDFLTPAELAIIYPSADVLFFPSRIDSFGLVYLEALASGTPVLSIRAAAAPEIISDDVGILCNPVQPFFAVGLANIFKKRYSRLKIAKYAQDNFSNDIMVRNYLHVYEQLFEISQGEK